jgi:hypothetical protein
MGVLTKDDGCLVSPSSSQSGALDAFADVKGELGEDIFDSEKLLCITAVIDTSPA